MDETRREVDVTPFPGHLLDAPHLEAEEEAAERGEQVECEFTFANAVDHIRRRQFWVKQLQAIDEQEQALIAPLLAEIERIKQWAQSQRELPQKRIEYHDKWLEAYYRANPPMRGKTIKLPGGELSMRAQQPEWDYDDEDRLAQYLWEKHAGAWVRVKHVVDKAALKQDVEVRPDGTVAIKGTGEVIPGVVVKPRPPKFEFKPV